MKHTSTIVKKKRELYEMKEEKSNLNANNDNEIERLRNKNERNIK